MKRFGGDRVKAMMERFSLPEDEPIEHNLVSKTIQQAQVRVEGYNFDIRKHILEYDDVVNKQREVIYAQRRQVLQAESLREQFIELLEKQIDALIGEHLGSDDPEAWDLEGLYRDALALFPVPEHISVDGWQTATRDQIAEQLLVGAYEAYNAKEAELGPVMREAERRVMLEAIDNFWVRHLTDLDILREGIGLMAVAQRDPLVEYKREAFAMWQALQDQIQRRAVRNIFRVQVQQAEPLPLPTASDAPESWWRGCRHTGAGPCDGKGSPGPQRSLLVWQRQKIQALPSP